MEVIIFERGSGPAQAEESWRPGSNQALSHSQNLLSLERVAKTPTTLSATSRLKRLESTLKGSGNRILQSARWVLNARTYQDATTFNLSSSELKAFIKIYKTSLIFADLNLGLISRTPIYNDNTGNDANTATGSLLPSAVSQIPATSTSTSATTVSTRPVVSNAPLFFINEKRRLKFKEIHYFDHPRFGAILGVWPAG